MSFSVEGDATSMIYLIAFFFNYSLHKLIYRTSYRSIRIKYSYKERLPFLNYKNLFSDMLSKNKRMWNYHNYLRITIRRKKKTDYTEYIYILVTSCTKPKVDWKFEDEMTCLWRNFRLTSSRAVSNSESVLRGGLT